MRGINMYGSDWYPEEQLDLDFGTYNPKCNHKWKSILLLNLTVYDCEKCGAKREKEETIDKFNRAGYNDSLSKL
jgi:hypothetical protein